MNWFKIFWLYLFCIPWLASLLIGLAIVACRCRDRRALVLAFVGLAILAFTSVFAHYYDAVIRALQIREPKEVLAVVTAAVIPTYFWGKAVGVLLLVVAAFVGRSPTAGRSPAPSSSATGPR